MSILHDICSKQKKKTFIKRQRVKREKKRKCNRIERNE